MKVRDNHYLAHALTRPILACLAACLFMLLPCHTMLQCVFTATLIVVLINPFNHFTSRSAIWRNWYLLSQKIIKNQLFMPEERFTQGKLYSKFQRTVSKIKVHYDIEDSFISSSFFFFFFGQEVSCGTSKQPPVNQIIHCQSQCRQKLEGRHTEAAFSVQILHCMCLQIVTTVWPLDAP